MTIDRKFKGPWTGKLPTRFLMLSNELPRIQDSSGALAGRFVLLTLRHSFYGREDHELTERLTSDLRGILNWSLVGLHRLQERGRFVLPPSSLEAIQDLEDLSSPVGAFVRSRCRVEPGLECRLDEAFKAWGEWCREQGRDHFGTKATFGRDLHAVVSGLTAKGRNPDRKYVGIALR